MTTNTPATTRFGELGLMHQLAIYRLIDVLATFSSAEDPTDADREELEINKLRLQLYDYYTGLKFHNESE